MTLVGSARARAEIEGALAPRVAILNTITAYWG